MLNVSAVFSLDITKKLPFREFFRGGVCRSLGSGFGRGLGGLGLSGCLSGSFALVLG